MMMRLWHKFKRSLDRKRRLKELREEEKLTQEVIQENEKAAELLVKAAKQADNNTISPTCLLQAGQIFMALGQKDKALDCYNKIKNKYQQSSIYYEIDKYIEQAK